jgi:transcriptional regulator with XRE-family HTH domain
VTDVSELKAFAGLDKAIARLIVRDGRTRKEIAEVAGINPSMFSGYCSGRLVPSIEHLDRILTAIGVGVEELTYELRALDYRAPSAAPLVVWPPFLGKQEGAAASELLTTLLGEVRDLLRAQAKDDQMAGEEEAEEEVDFAPTDPEPVKTGRRRVRRSGPRHSSGPGR